MIDASAPRRVLMTTDTAGGVWTYTLELACSLVARGARVLLAACGPSIDLARREELSRLEGVEVAAREFRLEWMDDPWDDVDASGKWLLELEARFRPEVIHLNGFSHAALPFRAPTLVVGHSCVGSWHRAVLGHAMGDGWREYRSRVTRGLRRADLVTAPTEAMLDALRHEYGPFRAAGAIPNGRSPSAFPAAPEKKPCVAAVGRLWDAAKNLRALDLAAKDLPWPVAVAGECAHPNGSRAGFEHVEHRGVLGERDVATFLGDATIFAHPALYEPFGLAPLEAALAGCVLVLGDIPSLREVWGDAAVWVPPGEPVAIHEALRILIEDEGLRETYASRARARAKRYSPGRMARRYLALYTRLLSRAKTRAAAPRLVKKITSPRIEVS